jgi:hypothetical protein
VGDEGEGEFRLVEVIFYLLVDFVVELLEGQGVSVLDA